MKTKAGAWWVLLTSSFGEVLKPCDGIYMSDVQPWTIERPSPDPSAQIGTI